jgi:hypothetical protein
MHFVTTIDGCARKFFDVSHILPSCLRAFVPSCLRVKSLRVLRVFA